MIVDALTTFPEMLAAPLSCSIMGRAQAAGKLAFTAYDLRDWTHDRHRTTDDQIDQTATVHQAVAMMLEHGTSGLPVTGASGGVVGFISDGDVMKALGRQDATAVDLVGALAIYHDDKTFEQRLAEVMESNVMELASHPAVCIDVSASIEEVCTLLGGRRLKKAPVLDGGRLAGTVSRTDVNRCLMRTFVALGEVHGVR